MGGRLRHGSRRDFPDIRASRLGLPYSRLGTPKLLRPGSFLLSGGLIMRVRNQVAGRVPRHWTRTALMSLGLLAGPFAGPIAGQAGSASTVGFGFYWGSLYVASEGGESVNGAGGAVAYTRPFGERVETQLSTALWYGSTQEETVRRVTVSAAARVYPSTSAPVFVKAGGGLSWDLEGSGADLAGLLGVGWDIRGLLTAVVTPFIDAAFFGSPDPLPTLRLISGGVQVGWPF